ncbi:hypothetical protein CC78DRAFT_543231 [Lojkania enalia]|uniref:Uncharacterized protein n=1 Tax=Lojkania enalia TaxID=147567 RepID=A0A9P4N4B8_9PLEO|nr:hypothetical protein CC78DRAFT_543231 [Didymosphaeria enalia]
MVSQCFSSPFSSTPPFMSKEYPAAWPSQTRRKTSAEHNAAMREIIKPWAGLSPSPVGCRLISSPHWSRFSSSTTDTKSPEEMTASVLWSPKATTPEFSPPPAEWTYLGAHQPKPMQTADNPNAYRNLYRQQGSQGSWATQSPETCSKNHTELITFKREAVKGVATASLLTASFTAQPGAGIQRSSSVGLLSRDLGKSRLSTSMLPSAFESDSEYEDDD